MESKKINQLATELAPELSDLTIIGDPTTGISKKITLSQMASLFTGTVEEYANLASFPLVGTADTIYIALDTNIIYRWNTGTSAYVELSPNIVTSLVFSDANGFDGTISLVGSTATLTITTALTQGSVPFIGASGALSQDNANLFFDDTNNRLGVNTNVPTTALDVFGSGIIGRLNGTSTNNAFLGFASAGSNKWSIGNVQSDHRFRIYSETNTSELVSVLQTGEFGIGIANPTTKLHIDGGASALIANLDANVSVAKSISFRSDNSNRFNIEVSGTESGSNAGADLFIRRYSDAGALIDTPLTITRSTGAISLATALTVPNGGTGATSFSSNVILKGAGTSAITTSLLTDTGTNLTYTGEEIVINKTGGAFLSLLSADTDTQYIQFKDTGGASGSIRYNHTNNSMIFKGNGSDILTLASTGAATFSNSVGTTALNMNNMSALGSIAGGSIYLPYTATINFRSADGQNGYGAITADTSSNLILNNNVGIGMTPDVNLQVKAISGSITRFRIGPSASGFELNQDNGGFTSCTIKNIYSTTNNAAELSLQSGFITFKTDTSLTERMRITAQGYFKFSNDGTYYNATGTYNEIRQAAGSGEIIYGTATSGTYTGTLIALDTSRAANTAFNFYSGNANGVAQFRVSGTGVIYAQNTSVQAISSDVNLKTDIVNYDKGLSEVLLMKPRYFKYKNNLDTTIAGFIAQEMDEAIPGSMVDGEPNKEGETFKTYQVDWHPLLVKAIQEQQAQIEELKALISK